MTLTWVLKKRVANLLYYPSGQLNCLGSTIPLVTMKSVESTHVVLMRGIMKKTVVVRAPRAEASIILAYFCLRYIFLNTFTLLFIIVKREPARPPKTPIMRAATNESK